jgi:hypothetical protein
MAMKRATKFDRDLSILRDVYNHTKKAFTSNEAAIFKMRKMLYNNYENAQENSEFKEVGSALIYFDLNPKDGPKIGIIRCNRLRRHWLLGIDVPPNAVDVIEEVDWVGNRIYGEGRLFYTSRLIDTFGNA